MKKKFILKNTLFLLFAFCYNTIAHCQRMSDSLHEGYQHAKTNEEKGRILSGAFIRPSATECIANANAVREDTNLAEKLTLIH